MGRITHPSLERLKQILERQDPPAFGPTYVPSIRATREEAPSFTSASEVWSVRLGRYVHVLSKGELSVLGIALQCPWLFELQEQRLLHFDERPHPLHGHPLANGLKLVNLRGAVQIAESLGVLRYYPVIWVLDETGVRRRLPFVYAGDFLLFLADTLGPFCVNLDVKATRDAFHMPHPRARSRRDPVIASQKEEARHLIERVRYLDGSIKTLNIATDDDIDPHLAANVRELLMWHKRSSELADESCAEVVDNFQAALVRGDSALEAIYQMIRRRPSFNVHQLKVVLYQAIMNRQLRVDLFQPIYIDKPLRPEVCDVLDRYKAWFSRG